MNGHHWSFAAADMVGVQFRGANAVLHLPVRLMVLREIPSVPHRVRLRDSLSSCFGAYLLDATVDFLSLILFPCFQVILKSLKPIEIHQYLVSPTC